MRRALTGGIVAFVVGSVFVPAELRAEDDPWTSRDKVIHYGVSAGIAAGGYVAGALVFDTRAHALVMGAGAATIAGVGKELVDLGGHGNASWKDLAWDGLGMITGLALAWGVDLLIRGISAERPAIARTGGGIAF